MNAKKAKQLRKLAIQALPIQTDYVTNPQNGVTVLSVSAKAMYRALKKGEDRPILEVVSEFINDKHLLGTSAKSK